MTGNSNPDKSGNSRQTTHIQTNTGGGAAVEGDVHSGRDFTGRDQREQSDDVTGGKFHAQQQTITIYNAPAAQPQTEPSPTTKDDSEASPPPLPDVPNPYRGLEPFEVEHAANYFGRAAMVEKLLAKLQATNFVAVVGPSGSGKSSLVRAGLVAALQEGRLFGSRNWQIVIIRPGDDPLRALATPLVNCIAPELQPVARIKQIRAMAASLQDGSVPIADVLAEVRTLHPRLSRLLLILDQFEETFTLCSDDVLRRIFLQTLLAVADTPWVTVLFTLRADFYGRILEDEPFGTKVDAGLVNVLPMTAEERRAAIEEPARNAGRCFEEGLIRMVLDDIEAEPGGLPLLQFALAELWKRQTKAGVLTHPAYHEIGRVAGAIAKHADETLQSLQQGEQIAVPHIFTRLVSVAQPDWGEDTKRRIGLVEIDPAMHILVRKLADARLLVTSRNEQNGEETVEIAHEALIRIWSTLRSWLDNDRRFLLWRQRLRSLAHMWYEGGRSNDALINLRSSLLDEGINWIKERWSEFSSFELDFIKASLHAEEIETRMREAARQQELEKIRSRSEAAQKKVFQLSLALLIAVILAATAIYFYFDAQKQRGIAQANTDLANQQLARLDGLRLLQEAEQFKASGNMEAAITNYTQAAAVDTSLNINLLEQEQDVRRQAAILLVQSGEEIARNGNLIGAAEKYQEALKLKPPADTPVYIKVSSLSLTVGVYGLDLIGDASFSPEQHTTDFWILNVPVTNLLYKQCVINGSCTPPDNIYWNESQWQNWPVTNVNWTQAKSYANWLGGRLPTSLEWEQGCWASHKKITAFYGIFSNLSEWTIEETTWWLRQTPVTSFQDYIDLFKNDRFVITKHSWHAQDRERCSQGGATPELSSYDMGFRVISPGF